MKINFLRFYAYVLMMFAFTSCGFFDSGPTGTLKAFYKEVETGKLTEATGRLTGPAVQMLGNEKLKASLAEQSEKMKQKGGIKSIEIKSEEINGEVATVEALLNFGDGSTDSDKTKFIKGEKGWLIVAE